MTLKEESLSRLDKLQIISDDPLFEIGYLAKEDAFDHKSYADTILGILKKNRPPLNIGLFGKWGIGKSTIINILRRSIVKSKIDAVYFNAWKHSDDSFRREFLITCVTDLFRKDPQKRDKIINRIKTLFHKALPKEKDEDVRFFTQLADIFKSSLTLNPKYTVEFVLIFGFFMILMVIGWVYSNDLLFFSSLLLTLLSLILIKQIPNIFEIRKHEYEVVDPQLILPEQFSEEFNTIITDQPGDKILIIIDDFDRCESEMVYDILTAMKTNLKNKKCFFLVALDDKQIIRMLKNKVRIFGYQEEALRKFFDVSLRIAPLAKIDLIAFANSIAERTGIPDNVIQIAVLAGYDEPRKIKHFLNAFIVKYKMVRIREQKGLLPFNSERHLEALAKMVVIEMQWPEAYEKIISQPDLLDKITKITMEK